MTIINLGTIYNYKLEHLSHYQFICPKQNCKNIVCDQLNFIRLENVVVLCYIMSLKSLVLGLQQTLIDSYKKNNGFITVIDVISLLLHLKWQQYTRSQQTEKHNMWEDIKTCSKQFRI